MVPGTGTVSSFMVKSNWMFNVWYQCRFGSFTVCGKWCQVLGTWHKHGFDLYRKVVTGTCYYFLIQFNAVLVSCTLMCCMYMLFCQAVPQQRRLTQVSCQLSHEVAVSQLGRKKWRTLKKQSQRVQKEPHQRRLTGTGFALEWCMEWCTCIVYYCDIINTWMLEYVGMTLQHVATRVQ